MLALCDPCGESLAQPLRFCHADHQHFVAAAVIHQRSKSGDLPFRFDDSLVCGIEVIEQATQCGDARLDVGVFQHVVAHEFGNIGHRLHRHGLIEQIQCLLARQTHTPPKILTVSRKAVVQRNRRHFAQTFFEFLNIFTETGKIACDSQLFLGNNVETLRLTFVVLHPEHLRQGHGFVEMLIAKTPEDDRVTSQAA